MKRYSIYCTVLLLMGFLGIYGEHLVLHFSDGTEYPLPYQSALYTTADQELLHKGIPFSSQQELSLLLEDYLS